jgi:hypothetical protein
MSAIAGKINILLVEHKLSNVFKNTAFFLIATLTNHFQEMVDVHALVNIKEKCDGLAWPQVLNLDLFQLTRRLDIRFVLFALHRRIHIQNVVSLFV